MSNTKAEASMVGGAYRTFLAKRFFTLQVHAGLKKADEEKDVLESCAKLPFDELHARIAQAEVFSKRLDELGIHAPETYGAGAAVEAHGKQKDNFTVGDLSGGSE